MARCAPVNAMSSQPMADAVNAWEQARQQQHAEHPLHGALHGFTGHGRPQPPAPGGIERPTTGDVTPSSGFDSPPAPDPGDGPPDEAS